jgi:hypothetical protein
MRDWPDPRLPDRPISRFEIGVAIGLVTLGLIGWLL